MTTRPLLVALALLCACGSTVTSENDAGGGGAGGEGGCGGCGPCGACVAGTCAPVYAGIEIAACGAYRCDGVSQACPTTCASDADCIEQHTCAKAVPYCCDISGVCK